MGQFNMVVVTVFLGQHPQAQMPASLPSSTYTIHPQYRGAQKLRLHLLKLHSYGRWTAGQRSHSERFPGLRCLKRHFHPGRFLHIQKLTKYPVPFPGEVNDIVIRIFSGHSINSVLLSSLNWRISVQFLYHDSAFYLLSSIGFFNPAKSSADGSLSITASNASCSLEEAFRICDSIWMICLHLFCCALLSIMGSTGVSTCPDAFQVVGCMKISASATYNILMQLRHALPPYESRIFFLQFRFPQRAMVVCGAQPVVNFTAGKYKSILFSVCYCLKPVIIVGLYGAQIEVLQDDKNYIIFYRMLSFTGQWWPIEEMYCLP